MNKHCIFERLPPEVKTPFNSFSLCALLLPSVPQSASTSLDVLLCVLLMGLSELQFKPAEQEHRYALGYLPLRTGEISCFPLFKMKALDLL